MIAPTVQIPPAGLVRDEVKHTIRRPRRLENRLVLSPSDANFILIQTRDANEFTKATRQAGILVRVFSSDPALTNCVRITVGKPEDNTRLLDAVSAQENDYAD